MCVPEARVPRTGLGFDVHRFATGRELWLGGVRFEGEDGLMGHSDGDTICHAVADALLGASALGDVGEHFPESDTATEGISGSALLGRVVELLDRAGFTPSSCEATHPCRSKVSLALDKIGPAMSNGPSPDRCWS